MKYVLAGFCMVTLLLACNFDIPRNDAKLVIQNKCNGDFPVITDVWTHAEGSAEWTSRWNGSIEKDNEVSIILPPAAYDIKIRVNYLLYSETFETGYKQPVAVKANETKFIIFDGAGIYDMEVCIGY